MDQEPNQGPFLSNPHITGSSFRFYAAQGLIQPADVVYTWVWEKGMDLGRPEHVPGLVFDSGKILGLKSEDKV